jgi:hypothetical protein
MQGQAQIIENHVTTLGQAVNQVDPAVASFQPAFFLESFAQDIPLSGTDIRIFRLKAEGFQRSAQGYNLKNRGGRIEALSGSIQQGALVVGV